MPALAGIFSCRSRSENFSSGRRLVDDQPHGPLGGVGAEEDHRAREPQVAHARHGDQELPVEERCVVIGHGGSWCRIRAIARRRPSATASRRFVTPPVRRRRLWCAPPQPDRVFHAPRLCASPPRHCSAAWPASARRNPATAAESTELRLIEGWRREDGAQVAAIVIRLEPGWHTYWRVPGAGASRRDSTGPGRATSASVAYEWPRPVMFDTYGAPTLGFKENLVLPVVLTPLDPDAPVDVTVDLAFGVCNDICIPAAGAAERAHRRGPRRPLPAPRSSARWRRGRSKRRRRASSAASCRPRCRTRRPESDREITFASRRRRACSR